MQQRVSNIDMALQHRRGHTTLIWAFHVDMEIYHLNINVRAPAISDNFFECILYMKYIFSWRQWPVQNTSIQFREMWLLQYLTIFYEIELP
jgi:hypothetical protein